MCKIAQVEVLTHLRCKHRAPPQLLVQHQDDTVDAHGGARALICYNLSACHLIQKDGKKHILCGFPLQKFSLYITVTYGKIPE